MRASLISFAFLAWAEYAKGSPSPDGTNGLRVMKGVRAIKSTLGIASDDFSLDTMLVMRKYLLTDTDVVNGYKKERTENAIMVHNQCPELSEFKEKQVKLLKAVGTCGTHYDTVKKIDQEVPVKEPGDLEHVEFIYYLGDGTCGAVHMRTPTTGLLKKHRQPAIWQFKFLPPASSTPENGERVDDRYVYRVPIKDHLLIDLDQVRTTVGAAWEVGRKTNPKMRGYFRQLVLSTETAMTSWLGEDAPSLHPGPIYEFELGTNEYAEGVEVIANEKPPAALPYTTRKGKRERDLNEHEE